MTLLADGVLNRQDVEDQMADSKEILVSTRRNCFEPLFGFRSKTLDPGFGSFEVVGDFLGE